MTTNTFTKAKKGLFLSIFALTAMQQIASAQQLDKTKLDSYFQALETSNKFMGSVAISQEGKVIYTHSTGMADVEKGLKSTDQSIYRIGSISKVFTATLIFKAIDDKKLDLGQKLSVYFPTIKNADKITIGQLLQHRSGIHNITDDASYLTWYTKPQTEAAMLAFIVAGGSDFEPDSKADYSNSNYILLSYILQKVYKKPYAILLTEKICKPLGLKSTYFGTKTDPGKKEVYSYHYTGSWVKEPETDMSVPMGAGAIVSTPADLTRFATGLFTGKLVSAASLAQMKEMKDDYGKGLFETPFEDKVGYGHSGGIDGFNSMIAYYPADGRAFSFIANGVNYETDKILKTMQNAAYGKPFEVPEFKSFAVSAAELTSFAGVYATKEIPVTVTIAVEGSILTAQATGQSAFPLEPIAKNTFQFEQGGIVIEFNPEIKKMTLKQGGKAFDFTKE
ncbi:peptidase [Taibaiella sp. KBW10]|uniref:serine hydrolase domain-containing protein n=1 Tax=Taibaiella sp. KBW10 TaxID=2153357 RepID=UPI000F5932F6|nr:serine hydrolase domain-containing protein [Taibaiella sp. KBW10]RQO31161.1 peptidase [Taibaiella sp. KBW10]